MRLLLAVAVLAAGGGIAWSLVPTPAGACICKDPLLVSEIEPIDGSTTGPSLCIMSRFHAAFLIPCDATAYHPDELFLRTE